MKYYFLQKTEKNDFLKQTAYVESVIMFSIIGIVLLMLISSIIIWESSYKISVNKNIAKVIVPTC